MDTALFLIISLHVIAQRKAWPVYNSPGLRESQERGHKIL